MKFSMKRSLLLAGTLLALAALLLPAQSSERRRPGRPDAATSIEIITRTINDCENNTDKFVRSLRRALNRSSLDGTAREDDLNRATKDLERTMDRVGRAWNRDKDISKTRSLVREAISSARNVNATMRSRRLDSDVERDWIEVRGQLNLLARAFKLPTISW